MKLYWLILIWTFNANAQWYFGQGEAVNLTNRIKYSSGQTSEVGVLDPSVSGLARSIGSTYSNTTTGKMYVKTTAPSTGWEEVNVGAPVVPTNFLAADQAASNWYLRSYPTDNSWRDVAYGNGLFVVVANSGTGNRVMTSPDGVNWTLRATPADNLWTGITYGNGLFVAVSNSASLNNVMTSPDGVTWTLRTTPNTNTLTRVTYGNGLFVAVASTGTGNRVITSPDGINWTARTSAADNAWWDVTYGNGLFVAVASSGTGNRVMTSPNGIDWTIRTSAADNTWFGVKYGNGLFVAVASSGTGNRVMTSPDGINWTARTSAADNSWFSLSYGNGLFVAVGQTGTGNRIMVSADGIRWATRTSVADNAWAGITYGNGVFVAVAETGTGNRVMTSPFYDLYSYFQPVFKAYDLVEYNTMPLGYEAFFNSQIIPSPSPQTNGNYGTHSTWISDTFVVTGQQNITGTCRLDLYNFLVGSGTLQFSTAISPYTCTSANDTVDISCVHPYLTVSHHSTTVANTRNNQFYKWNTLTNSFTRTQLDSYTGNSREIIDVINEGNGSFLAIARDADATVFSNIKLYEKPNLSETWTYNAIPFNRNTTLAPAATWRFYSTLPNFPLRTRDYILVGFTDGTNHQTHLYKLSGGSYNFVQQVHGINTTSISYQITTTEQRGFLYIDPLNSNVGLTRRFNGGTQEFCRFNITADVFSIEQCTASPTYSTFVSMRDSSCGRVSNSKIFSASTSTRIHNVQSVELDTATIASVVDSSLFEVATGSVTSIMPDLSGIISFDAVLANSVGRMKVNPVAKPKKVAP